MQHANRMFNYSAKLIAPTTYMSYNFYVYIFFFVITILNNIILMTQQIKCNLNNVQK